jgi:chromosome segregation ATPase
MALLIPSLVTALITSGLIFAAYVLFKRRTVGSAGAESGDIGDKISAVMKNIDGLLRQGESLVSPKQIENVDQQILTEKANLLAEQEKLKEVDAKLTTAQKMVEDKEAQQQELKSSKVEDENKLQELLTNYETLTNESVALEQQLADSLKTLDSISKDTAISPQLKILCDELNNSITNSSSRLRELLSEYQVVNERLQVLMSQHRDLEEEYTKLVEQQLGE